MKEWNHLENLSIDERIILKLILKSIIGTVDFSKLAEGPAAGCCGHSD
jgi:hypothetical protein